MSFFLSIRLKWCNDAMCVHICYLWVVGGTDSKGPGAFRNAKRYETITLQGWALYETVIQNEKRNEVIASEAWAPCGAPSSVWGMPKSSGQGPPLVGGVGGYNHHGIGEGLEWRPPLSYANPLGHCIPPTCQNMHNTASMNGCMVYAA